jgi:hypothetical protein
MLQHPSKIPHHVRHAPRDDDAAVHVRVVPHRLRRRRQRAEAEHEVAHRAQQLLAVKAVRHAERMLEQRLVVQEERKVEHGDAVGEDCCFVLRQAEAVRDPVFDARALQPRGRTWLRMRVEAGS